MFSLKQFLSVATMTRPFAGCLFKRDKIAQISQFQFAIHLFTFRSLSVAARHVLLPSSPFFGAPSLYHQPPGYPGELLQVAVFLGLALHLSLVWPVGAVAATGTEPEIQLRHGGKYF